MLSESTLVLKSFIDLLKFTGPLSVLAFLKFQQGDVGKTVFILGLICFMVIVQYQYHSGLIAYDTL